MKEDKLIEVKDRSLKIDKTDIYKIQVEGDNHKDDFLVTWKIE